MTPTDPAITLYLRAALAEHGWAITTVSESGPVGTHADGSTVRWAARFNSGSPAYCAIRVKMKAPHPEIDDYASVRDNPHRPTHTKETE